MRQNVYARLAELEVASASAARRARAATLVESSAMAELRAKIHEIATDPRYREMRANPPADLPMRMRELRRQLMERAHGHRQPVLI